MCFDGIVDFVVQRFLFHRHDAYETLAKPLCLGFGAVDDLDDVHLGGRAIVVERRDDVRPGCLQRVTIPNLAVDAATHQPVLLVEPAHESQLKRCAIASKVGTFSCRYLSDDSGRETHEPFRRGS